MRQGAHDASNFCGRHGLRAAQPSVQALKAASTLGFALDHGSQETILARGAFCLLVLGQFLLNKVVPEVKSESLVFSARVLLSHRASKDWGSLPAPRCFFKKRDAAGSRFSCSASSSASSSRFSDSWWPSSFCSAKSARASVCSLSVGFFGLSSPAGALPACG